MPSNYGISADEMRDFTLTNQQISAIAAILESKIQWDVVNGHNHNGTNSRPVSGGAASPRIFDSTFTGAINGTNATLTLPTNFLANSTAVWMDGIRQKRGVHYNEVGPNQIEFVDPIPVVPSAATIVIDYSE